jgi:hypothetical protein
MTKNLFKNKFYFSAILNVVGNVMTLTALLFVIQFASLPNVIQVALNLKMQFAMLNVKNLNAR